MQPSRPPDANVVHLVFHLRPARRRAQAVAVAEALSLLRGLHPSAPRGGPLSEQGGVFWVDLPRDQLQASCARLPRLGYSMAVDQVDPLPTGASPHSIPLRWRGRSWRLRRVYQEDAAAFRQAAPDRRSFVLPWLDGRPRLVRGYRGDGGPLSRRALPVCDARLLVNLVHPGLAGETFLDPFAGGAGLVVEALASGHRVLTSDIDPRLRYGLAATGATHCVADVRRLPFAPGTIAAIATELPFNPVTAGLLERALFAMQAALRPGGRLSLMCATWQRGLLREAAGRLSLVAELDAAIDRKGTPCAVLAWAKAPP